MKTTMKTSCMVLASLVMTISANAQFSYGAKKKTTPATTTKDTVITKPVTKPVTNNQVVVAPTVSEVKPTKLDQTLAVIKEEYGKAFKISFAQGYNLSDDNDFLFI